MNIANRRKIAQSKFLTVPMVDNKFTTHLDLEYNGNNFSLHNVIIDTGCSYSLISYNEIYIFTSNQEQENIKRIALRKYMCSLGYGIETSMLNKINLNTMTLDDKVKCRNVRTLEPFSNIRIGGVYIGNKTLNFSYDLDCPSLIGMEILKDWDIHISKSLRTGRTILMACPLDRVSQSYIQALIDEFGIGQQVIDKLLEKVSCQSLEANYVNNKISALK